MKTLTIILLAISLNSLGQDLFLFGDYDNDYDEPMYKNPESMFGTAALATTFAVNYKLVRTDEFSNMSDYQQQQATLKNYAIGAAVTIGGVILIKNIKKSKIFNNKRPKRYKKHKSTLKFR